MATVWITGTWSRKLNYGGNVTWASNSSNTTSYTSYKPGSQLNITYPGSNPIGVWGSTIGSGSYWATCYWRYYTSSSFSTLIKNEDKSVNVGYTYYVPSSWGSGSTTLSAWTATYPGTNTLVEQYNVSSTLSATASYSEWSNTTNWYTFPTTQDYWNKVNGGKDNGYYVSGWKTTNSRYSSNTYTPGANVSSVRWGTFNWYPLTSPNTYKITLNLNYSGAPARTIVNVTYNGTCSNITTPDRGAGYIFKGWYTNSDGTGTAYNSSTKYTIIGNLTLYAHWVVNEKTVTINANGGTIQNAPSWKIRLGGGTATRNIQITTQYNLPTPVRPMYKFNGWYDAQTGGNKVELNATFNNDSPTLLYAQWTQNGAVVTIEDSKGLIPSSGGWSVTEGGKKATRGITYDEVYNVPTLSKQFWNFDGWYTAQTGGTKIESTTKFTKTSATTLYARWSPQNILIFDCGIGCSKPGETSLVTAGDESKFYKVMTKKTSNNSTMWTPVHYNSTDSTANKKLKHSQYLFDGWWTKPNGGEQIYEFVSLQECRAIKNTTYWGSKGGYALDPANPPESRVLYAHWKPINMYAFNTGFNPPNGNYAYPTSYIPIREAYAYKDGVWKKVEFSAYRSGWKNGWGGN